MTTDARKQSSPIQVLLTRLLDTSDRLYAVIDAAKDTALLYAARDRFKLTSHTLFEGDLAQYLDHVAPHMIPFERDSGFLDLWLERRGHSAGILLLTPADADALRGHLRKIFVVADEDNEEFSFRYYDPRVVRVYLPTCTVAEARDFFGPIRRILVESEQPETLLCCTPDETGVAIQRFPIPRTEGSATTGGQQP